MGKDSKIQCKSPRTFEFSCSLWILEQSLSYSSSVLPTVSAVWNNIFCTEGHRSDISQVSSGSNKFNITQYFHLLC